LKGTDVDFSINLFHMPVLEFAEEDLNELLEPFDPEKAGRRVQVGLAVVSQAIEPTPKSCAESLQLFSLY
jgi:hypothetical protein